MSSENSPLLLVAVSFSPFPRFGSLVRLEWSAYLPDKRSSALSISIDRSMLPYLRTTGLFLATSIALRIVASPSVLFAIQASSFARRSLSSFERFGSEALADLIMSLYLQSSATFTASALDTGLTSSTVLD